MRRNEELDARCARYFPVGIHLLGVLLLFVLEAAIGVRIGGKRIS